MCIRDRLYTAVERFLWNVNDVRHVSFWTNVCLRVAAVNQNSVYVVATVKLHRGRSQNPQSRWLAYWHPARRTVASSDVTSVNITAHCVWRVYMGEYTSQWNQLFRQSVSVQSLGRSVSVHWTIASSWKTGAELPVAALFDVDSTNIGIAWCG